MKNKLKKVYSTDGRDRLLPKFSLFVFDRSRTAAIIWLCLTIFGILSYTTLLKREGFPSINIPYSVVSGTYFVNDPQKVDAQVAKPVSDIALKDSRVKSVQAQSEGDFYGIAVQYKEGTDANQAGSDIKKSIEAANVLPASATLKIETPKIGFTERGDDGVISIYAKRDGVSVEQLVAEGQRVAQYVKDQNYADMESISVIDPFATGTDPVTGQAIKSQNKFDRYGVRADGQNTFYDSVSVGYGQIDGTDVIKLDGKLRKAIAAYNEAHKDSPYTAVISATYANDIKDQIGGLQKSLLEGLLAVLVIGSIIIAVRASLITVLAMITVLAITLGVLYIIGYTLNTITLFALVLCLGLIVDDTIIMVEAIDAQRRRRKDPREIVHIATRKVSRAMVAATSTAIFSFAPLLFVHGILGSFIRAIPVTVITALLVSLLVALVFIPFFARYLLLGKKQLGDKNLHEPAARYEAKIANFIGKPMLWARHSTKKLFFVGIVAIIIGFGFIGAAGFLFQKVTFNIFPSGKDGNGLSVRLTLDPGTTITQAETVADRADRIVADTLGENFKSAAYYSNASAQNASLVIYLTSFKDRDVTSPQLAKKLEAQFKNFPGAQAEIGQLDAGPPASGFAVRIESTDRVASLRLAKDINTFLANRELTRVSGVKAKIISTNVSDPGTYSRADGKLYMEVGAKFDGTDTTTLVTLAKDAVQKEFTAARLQSYGLSKDVLNFDIGQEQENQDSFSTLAKAFPILLLVIFLLLALQFRSLLQPLLIFMAIPFSLFGITLGLYLTDNPFSFFAMLGFFALLGLSIKNTILLTDYANQLRREGVPAVDAAVGALSERFRPLIATSLTAVVSLTPLYLSDPFWESLTVVLIFGLLSSTFLVITVFPYYYLGAEYLRLRVTRSAALLWLGLTIVISMGLIKAGVNASIIPAVAIGVFILELITYKVMRHRKRSK
ncbi:MAG TPA: efflux RND transporter permease subunit [Patescibacteria group bacterium]|nr:efflux RND transporter permease subunit [Patescibacteria group bacterium]